MEAAFSIKTKLSPLGISEVFDLLVKLSANCQIQCNPNLLMMPEARARFDYFKHAPPITLRGVIFEGLAHALAQPAGTFHQNILSIFIENLPIRAASFYAYDPEYKLLLLLRQHGFDYADYESFELAQPNLALKAATELTPQIYENLTDLPDTRHKHLIEKYALESVVILPLVLSKNAAPECLGVIAMYPNDKSDLDSLLQLSKELSGFIGTLYYHHLQARMLLIRDEIISKAYLSQDLNSCLHRILLLTKTALNVEAGSIFLYDETMKLLRLHASTGINVDKSIPRQSIFYSQNDAKNNTWTTFQDNCMKCYRFVDGSGHQGKYVEKTAKGPQSFLGFPIKRTHHDNRHDVRGVIRLVNKKAPHDHKEEVVGFMLEDKLLAEFITDMVSVIVHMFQSRERRVDFFEQIMHGTGSNISACLQNLDILERHGLILEKLDQSLHYHFTDTRDFLLDVKRQIDRLSTGAPLEQRDVKLGGEVLTKVVALFERMAVSRGVRSREITNLKDAGFLSLPEVVGDSSAMLTVFRNLVENAIKYRDIQSGVCKIDLDFKTSEEMLSIYFVDHGIGIPLAAKESIFRDGFRAENAVRQDPAGTGLGLAQCRDIMERMQGHIELENCKPTQFRIDFRRK